MTQYGDYTEPGIVTEVTSARGQPTAGDAPSDVGIVGQANLGGNSDQGSADPNTVHVVENDRTAREWFGHEDNSMLTQACLHALNEGAFPVYAVAAESTSVTDEDHSSTASTDVSLDNAPIREDSDSLTVTLDSTDLTTIKTFKDPSMFSPDSDECIYNPVSGTLEIPTVPSSSLDVDYDHFDYPTAHDAMVTDASEFVDFFTPLSENTSVVDDAKTTVANMEKDYDLAVHLAGAGIMVDATNYTNPYDDSRTQLIFGTRFEDGSSLLAAYAGKRAALGIESTPIRQRLETSLRIHPEQAENLSKADRGNLIDKNVVPLRDESGGARIMDDPTTVTSDNTDEFAMDFGYERLVADYIIETARENEQPFIGRLNRPAVRNALQELINSQLSDIEDSNLILNFNVAVGEKDATSAVLDISVETAEPLRNILNRVTFGEVA